MKNKELIAKLKELNSLTADQNWKAETRSFLYEKISDTPTSPLAEINILETILIRTKKFFAQPSFAIVAMIAIVVSATLFGPRAMKIMPGNSLYIARIISEEAQLAVTFNQNKKTKLEIKFSSDRAKQITDVLAQTKFSSTEESDKLSSDFKNEIAMVRNKIDEMKEAEEKESMGEESMVFTAGLEKESDGVEIFIPESGTVETTSAPDNTDQDTTNDIEKILITAEELFDLQDYEGAKNKISEADVLLDKALDENDEQKTDEEDSNIETDSETATSSTNNSETN